jgi:predicted enzyme related to lactoylglutathione lyase
MTDHGHFHWNELMTRKPERAKEFYKKTIGWTFRKMEMPDGRTYWVAMMKKQPVAGIFDLSPRMFKGVAESWMAYLAVDDVDKRVKKAVDAGARLMRPAFDVPGVGRIAMLTEPGGAGIGWMTPAS